MTCPICDTFAGFRSMPAPLEQCVISDMLLQARALPSEHAVKQAIIVDRKEASIVLATLYAILVQEQGGECAIGTHNITPHAILDQLENWLSEW
jgi:hypothetical protein